MEALVVGTPFTLKAISSRGTKVFPPTGTVLDVTDMYTCRLMAKDAAGDLNDAQILDVLQKVSGQLKWTHIEKLNEFDGQPGWTKAQGED
jgi:isocitrate dehydrogenase